MLFNSMSFAVFLPIVFSIYWILPHKFRWILLLISSYYFYMSWNPKYVFLIFFTTLVSFLAGILLEIEMRGKYRKLILASAAIICLGLLAFFKYFNFFAESVVHLFSLFSVQLDPLIVSVVLPVGISFYTLQTLSYVIDVYRGDIKAEHDLGIYATFVSFFPQLVAGPIERTANLLPQIKAIHIFDYHQATYGLKIMAWGFFKKLIIADGLSVYVSKVYDAPLQYQGFSLILATILFAIQIYCDFSGYSDIAIGTSKLFGIDLMTNFRSPYFSDGIKKLWSNWHISLSTWFRDYIYIPLGGNRVSKSRHYLNLLITFLISGFWHGANWTYVIWGGLHGIAQIAEIALIPPKTKNSHGLLKVFRIIITFAFTCFAYIFFASASLSDAIYSVSHMFTGISHPIAYLRNGFNALEFMDADLLSISLSLLLLIVNDYVSLKKDVILSISSRSIYVRWLIYILFMVFFILMMPFSTSTEFIYFQF